MSSQVVTVKWKLIGLIFLLLVPLIFLFHSRFPCRIFRSKNSRLLNEICYDISNEGEVDIRDKYWILKNYIRSTKQFKCHESITVTTNADFTFLDNIITMMEHWKGPLSIAVYAPGEDFFNTLKSIAYLRNCESPLIKDFTTFHIFFDTIHIPSNKNVQSLLKAYEDEYSNCSSPPPYELITRDKTYRKKHNLTYPINLSRNIAMKSSQTHLVLPLDIELYPSRGFIPKFLRFIDKNPDLLESNNVFVLSHFEVSEDSTIPNSKTELQQMSRNGKAFPFQQNLCTHCHVLPNAKDWMELEEGDELDIFTCTKRLGTFKSIEPFFVTARDQPSFDERFSWEGQSDKMVNGYALCLLDYNYLILDNAFLVHKPGIKLPDENRYERPAIRYTERLKDVVREEMNLIYGARKGCLLKSYIPPG